MRFRFVAIVLLVFALALSCSAQSAKHRVVLDVSTVLSDGWAQAIVNTQNLLTIFGRDNVQIEVVVRGPGLAMLMKSNTDFSEKLAALAGQGVQFSACGQTLASSRSDRRELLSFAVVVDSGVAELVRRQESGWSYIKSGF
ncbi:MAG: hypothetical protein CXZ00_09605 [Acidobacteria bacterium]|nr:MAG: hypothetical protein CXZ00_09605 [Acidobacteriota bacterium]